MELTKLIEKAKQSDKSAIEELYNEYYPMGFSLALQFVKNDEDAMDIMQDAFITVFSKLDVLDDTTKFKSWYMQIVANKCRDFLKKKNPLSFTDANIYDEDGALQFDIEDEDREFQPEESLDYTETANIVNGMLDNLPEEQKMCLLLYYVNDLKISEIAESLGVSEATVKSRLKYGKEKLRSQVETYEKANNVKLHSLSGVALIPFIRWMLKGQAASVASSYAPVIQKGFAAVFQSGAGEIVKGGLKMGEKTNLISKIVNTFKTFSVAKKVVSATIAGAIVAGGIGIGVAVNNNNDSYVESSSKKSSKTHSNLRMVDLNEYIDVKFEGVNGEGMAIIELDEEGLAEEVEWSTVEKIIQEQVGDMGVAGSHFSGYDDFSDLLYFEFKSNENLSNGDKIFLNVNTRVGLNLTISEYQEALGIKFQTKLEFTVSDLPNYKSVKILEEVANYVSYKGGSGGAEASIDLPKDFEFKIENLYFVRGFFANSIKVLKDNSSIGEFSVEFLENENLSNGDEIQLQISDYYYDDFNESEAQEELKALGFFLSKKPYKFTVSGLGEYIKAGESIPDFVLEEIKIRVNDKLKNYEKAMEYYSATFKPTIEANNADRIAIKVIFKSSYWSTYYSYLTINNIILNSDNTITCDIRESYDSEDTIEQIKEIITEEYIIEQIG